MTVNKLQLPAKDNAVQLKINEIIDNIPPIAASVSSSSTNNEAVGAKLFYDTVGNIESLLSEV